MSGKKSLPSKKPKARQQPQVENPLFKILYVKISAIKLNPDNPRVIKDQKYQKLVKSIREFPRMLAIRPIVVNAEMVVLGGNMRLRACKDAGLTDVPVLFADSLTPEQQKEFIVKDNVGFGEWDFEILANGYDSVSLSEWGLDVVAQPEVKVIPPGDPDEIPQPPKQPKTKPGDIYELGSHRLMCGDATNIDHVDKLMGGGKPDMVYTDPPYGIDLETDSIADVKTFKNQGVAKKVKHEKIIGDDSIDTAVGAYSICDSLSKIVVYWGGNYYAHKLPPSACWAVWDKRVEENQKSIHSDCELAYVKHPHKKSVRIFRHLWKGMLKASERKEARVHPTQKPVALAEWAFEEYDPKGKTVLDLFGGSGSTLIAAEKTGRTCFAMEIDPLYCDVIVARFEKYSGKKAKLL